jgi:hypothetical protein
MPPTLSTTSILPLSDYFTGLQPTLYDASLNQSNDIEIDEPFSAHFHVTVNSHSEQLILSIGSGREKTDLRRILGCIILARLPEAALDDGLRCLRDVWDSHIYTAMHTLPPPRPERVGAGQLVQKEKKPDLVINDD